MASRSRGYVLTIFPNLEQEFPWDPNTIDWAHVKPAVQFFVCQLEESPTTKKLHWQCSIEFKNPTSFKQVQECKLFSSGCSKPHIERRKGTALQSRDYCTKDDSCVDTDTRFTYGELCTVSETKDEIFRGALNAESLLAAIDHIKERAPRDFVLNKDTIERNLAACFKTREPNVYRDFKFAIPPIPRSYLESRSIFMHGDSGLGKTAYALSHFENPVFITHLDDAKKITDETDGAVFDDMSFTHWPRTTNIHLLDVEHECSLPTRYATTKLRRGLPRIFTSNENFEDVFNCKGTSGKHMPEALKRRVKSYHILGSLKYTPPVFRYRPGNYYGSRNRCAYYL
uniref:Replication-associated protein n=1 Tax=Cressdnaviricota sp. TaxID=2748378 RepID=A0A6M3YPA0_9VIRU|nr:MAG: replication-associated protein [Cressdnaviricota sp.]